MPAQRLIGPIDFYAAALAAVIGGGAWSFRYLAIAPRETVGICAAANPPGFCLPRHYVLNWQYHHVFGWAALALGLTAFVLGKRLVGALAIGIGVAAVVNYNGTYGIIGATFGLVAWMGVNSGRYEISG